MIVPFGLGEHPEIPCYHPPLPLTIKTHAQPLWGVQSLGRNPAEPTGIEKAKFSLLSCDIWVTLDFLQHGKYRLNFYPCKGKCEFLFSSAGSMKIKHQHNQSQYPASISLLHLLDSLYRILLSTALRYSFFVSPPSVFATLIPFLLVKFKLLQGTLILLFPLLPFFKSKLKFYVAL